MSIRVRQETILLSAIGRHLLRERMLAKIRVGHPHISVASVERDSDCSISEENSV